MQVPKANDMIKLLKRFYKVCIHPFIHLFNMDYSVRIVTWRDKDVVFMASKCLTCGKIADIHTFDSPFKNDELTIKETENE